MSRPVDRLALLDPDWPHRERSEIVAAGGMGFHVQCFGDAGPAVLLLHGTGASTHSFRDLAPVLADPVRVLAIDLPGHGASETPRGDGLTLPGMAHRIGALCDTLGFPPDAIVGHSAGAAIAIRAAVDGRLAPKLIVGLNAALQPMQGYALFSPLAKALFLNPLVPHLFARAARGERTAKRLIEQTGSRIDERGLRCYQRLFANPDHVYGALGMMAGWDLATLQRDMPRLACRLTLVTAADDGTVPARDAPAHVRRVRDGRHIALSKGGHLLHEERPREIAALLHGELERVGLLPGADDAHTRPMSKVAGHPSPDTESRATVVQRDVARGMI